MYFRTDRGVGITAGPRKVNFPFKILLQKLHFRTDRGFGITVGLFYIFSYTQLDARSPKRSSHEDSDVQCDVNIRVHEGAIDSVAMRMIMFKNEWEFGSRCVVWVESDLELLVTRRSSVKLRHCMVSVCSWAGLISNRLLCFTHRSFN